MEKKIVFVVREGLAIRNMNGQFNSFTGISSVVTVLTGLKDSLNQIPTNVSGLSEVFTTIYVPDMMNGLLSNSIGLYLRTGKTASGKIIDQAELDLYVEVFNMLNDRSYNVRLYNLKYVSKDDVATKNVIKNTWSALDREERKIMQQARAGIGASVQNPVNNAQLDSMQQQMVMMQQMMQMFGSMMQSGNMQMPNMSAMMPTQPIVNNNATVESCGDPTKLDINMGATEVTDAQDAVAVGETVTQYEPEF